MQAIILQFLKGKTGKIEHLNTLHGPPLGAMEDLSYRDEKILFQEGDHFISFTDGVTEAIWMKNVNFILTRG